VQVNYSAIAAGSAWVFAKQGAGVATFTLTIATDDATPEADERLIGYLWLSALGTIGHVRSEEIERHRYKRFPWIASASLTSNQTGISTTDTPIEFDSEKVDNPGWWNPATFRLTPTVEGWYKITLNVQWDINSGWQYAIMKIRKNGTAIFGQQNKSAGANTAMLTSFTAMVHCNGVDDYLDFTAISQSASVDIAGQSGGYDRSWFTAEHLGRYGTGA